MFIHDWTTILNIYVENEGKTLDFKQINISLTKMFILRCLELLCGRCHYPSLLRRRWETQFLFTFFNQENISNLIVSYLLHHTPPSRQVSFFFHQSCPSFLWLQPLWWSAHLYKLVFCSAASSHSSNQSFKGYFSSSHFVFCKVEEEPVLKMKLPDGQSVTGLRQSVSFISKSHHQDKGRRGKTSFRKFS